MRTEAERALKWVWMVAILGSHVACDSKSETFGPADNIVSATQPLQHPDRCRACHMRQFMESADSVKSGYRSVSPTMNSLELAGNFLAQGALDSGAIETNLRPRYAEDGDNAISADSIDDANTARAGFCIGCHNPALVLAGDNEAEREIPKWTGIADARPLRDYHFVDAQGNQVLPVTPGGPPPPGAIPSVSAHAISCDVCHNVAGPDQSRSLGRDGYANNALRYELTPYKTGPFLDGLPVGPHPDGGELPYHETTYDENAANFIQSSDFCGGCHDVRLPSLNLIMREGTPPVIRLENLNTEWRVQDYARADANPFGKTVRCNDCHMSLYPYAGDVTYPVVDETTGATYEVTSPAPFVFPVDKAASGTDPTGLGLPLPDRQVVTHRMTGVDVPLMSDEELKERLGPNHPGVDAPGTDAYGVPHSLKTRREDLMKASVRLFLDRTDADPTLGEEFNVRVTAIALTGHNFPAGFSQERTAWLEIKVVADQVGGGEFTLYQSGYQVDKPHPETGEMAPDGSLHDEDLEHVNVVVNPATHGNDVFESGPDAGPLERAFVGEAIGLVLFRNELIRIYGPATIGGRPTGIPAGNRNHPRTGEPLEHVLEEETFSAGAANTVDNWRSLLPLKPRTYRYAIDLPSRAELADLGIELTGEVRVRAAVHFQHFPPLFLRFLARVTSEEGPAQRDFGLMDEKRIDDHLRVVRDIAVAERALPLNGGQ